MPLISSNMLRGSLAYKGERGYSAYEVAVQNGFVGDEATWLATLGTSSHFDEDSVIHTSTANQTVFALPSSYTSNSFIDVYVNGLRLSSTEYTVGTTSITLTNALYEGNTVEIVTLTMSTNSLPIATSINSTSTNDTAAGTKAVYDIVNPIDTRVTTAEGKITAAEGDIDDLETSMLGKLDSSKIQVLTGSAQNIASGETKIVDISYPNGFTKAGTVIIGKMVSSNNNYYDTADETMTTNGYPIIETIALTDSLIRVWLKNTNNTQTRNGYYKITLLKVD